MAKRRAKKVGYINVLGQMMFVGLAAPLLARSAAARIREIEDLHDLRKDWDVAAITKVETVNSDETIRLLKSLDPKVVVVNGTRIISRHVLESVEAVFINMHAGITPLYRGVHGGYWARAERRPDLVGTTVHLVDKGIDTGTIIEQVFFEVTEHDNFASYPYLHTAHGIPVLLNAVQNCLDDELKLQARRNDLPSRLRYHPTIWGYLSGRIRGGVK
jgi:folate-dependent phosphoribosylglycinamide formyltransferase PurN